MDLLVIQNKVFTIRGCKVMLDFDLAELYEIETRTLKQAVRRNIERFPDDFMFELTSDELASLRSQIVILKKGRGSHVKYLPFAFTEQGVAMLSSVLNSYKAIQVYITIMRAFVNIRQHYLDSKELRDRIEKLEDEMQVKFNDIHQALSYLLAPPQKERRSVGFKQKSAK
ncbi:ORF6N domain-containing protein [Dyadobacter jiangsuensis]|uniref:ORF6N domain-containing protein n=1 Tax=Dyadobacter jiangsuensis TaxID=1591085 RepID=A0A2P8F9K7_9BACT|nr:ORF6N domain-containing protein [Dyadobacter jiangsuensis]PSL18411.1 ORF6N domain-containing protein [Dyadobacter jiangsuensis]